MAAGPTSIDQIAELMEENDGIDRLIEEMKLEIQKLEKEAEELRRADAD